MIADVVIDPRLTLVPGCRQLIGEQNFYLGEYSRAYVGERDLTLDRVALDGLVDVERRPVSADVGVEVVGGEVADVGEVRALLVLESAVKPGGPSR